MNELTALYHQDYSAWATRIIAILQAGNFSQLDVTNLISELQDMSKSTQRELESRLRILLAHLLKWQYQYQQLTERWREFDGKSWRSTITTQRTEIKLHLRKNPSMKSLLTTAINSAYADARELASDESDLSIELFPLSCPYTEQQILEQTFYPSPTITSA